MFLHSKTTLESESLRILLLITMVFLVGVSFIPVMADGYSPWQKGAIEGLKIGFKMGQMSTLANQGYNISGFNAEVDKYNAWVQQNFGNDTNLMMPKLPVKSYSNISSISSKPIHAMDASFNRTTPSLESWLANALALAIRCLQLFYY